MAGKRVLAAGKFDILHLGHLSYLEQARSLAGDDGKLLVVIARDTTIQKLRGAPPVFPQEQRRRLVEALRFVDEAILGYATADQTKIVAELKPDIIAVGYDQYADFDALEAKIKELGMDTQIVRLEKGDADGLCSSTVIRKRILKYYGNNGTPR